MIDTMKNKNKIIFGCIFSVVLIMILPSISAVEHNVVVETNKEKLKTLNINELQKLNNDLKNSDIEKELESINNGRSRILLKLLIYLLASFTSMIIKVIFNSIGLVFSGVIATIAVIIITIITTILTIIGSIVGGIALIVLGIAVIIEKIKDALGIQPQEE